MHEHIKKMTLFGSKYQVGDHVRVRDDLQIGEAYFNEDSEVHDAFIKPMSRSLGKDAEIIGIKHRKYILSIDPNNFYTDEMFESIVSAPYIYNEQVEAIVNHLMVEQKNNVIDQALDAKLHVSDPEKFKAIIDYPI